MDIPLCDAYFPLMLIRAVTLFVVLAFAVVGTAAFAHAARMSLDLRQAMHASETMMHDAGGGVSCCESGQRSEPSDMSQCKFVCHNVSVLVATSGSGVWHSYELAARNLSVAEIRAGRSPDLNERPPKTRLL